MKHKITIELPSAIEGMQLATDAIDDKGVCLIVAGATLTEASIQGLAKRNIKSIEIYQQEQLTPKQAQQRRAEIKTQLDYCFSKTQSKPLMSDLKQIFYNYRTLDL